MQRYVGLASIVHIPIVNEVIPVINEAAAVLAKLNHKVPHLLLVCASAVITSGLQLLRSVLQSRITCL